MSAENRSAKKNKFGKLILIVLAFILLVIFISTDFFLLDPAAREIQDFKQQFLINLNLWLPWLVIAFLVIWLSREYPLNKRTWKHALPAHLAVSIGLVFVHTIMAMGMFTLMERLDILDPEFTTGSLLTRVLHLDIIIYAIILGLSRHYDLKKNIRILEQKIPPLEIRSNQMNIQGLERQLFPHFIQNIMETISNNLLRDPVVADRMICRLNDLLRLDLENVSKLEIPLERELGFIKRYLEIMEASFQTKLRTEFHIPDEVQKALVPTFILPPLVENAIFHGIAPQEQGGKIEIGAFRKYRILVVQVSDSGVGLNQGQEDLIKPEKSLGLICARLKLLYAREYSFRLENLERKGAAAVLEIPFHLNPLD